MVGDQPRGFQVLLHKGRRHRQRFRRVVEAGLVGGIDGELLRRPDVDARQVANGVVVLGVAQPPRRHRAGIAGVPLRFVLADRLDPVDDILAGFGRSDAASPSPAASTSLSSCSRTSFPVREVLGHRFRGRVGAQVQVAFRLLLAVAPEAVGVEKRAHGVAEAVFERRRRRDPGCVQGRRPLSVGRQVPGGGRS